jgi:hypothetical protein
MPATEILPPGGAALLCGSLTASRTLPAKASPGRAAARARSLPSRRGSKSFPRRPALAALSSPRTSEETAVQRRPDQSPYGATVRALLEDGPLQGKTVEVDAVEGRPPKTIDVPDEKGGACRYWLAQWTQEGMTAAYTFLYAV